MIPAARKLPRARRGGAAPRRLWQRKLEREGVAIPADRPRLPGPRPRMARARLGSAAVVPMVLETEAGDADKYDQQGGEAREIADEEREHRKALAGMKRGCPTDARELIASRERGTAPAAAPGGSARRCSA